MKEGNLCQKILKPNQIMKEQYSYSQKLLLYCKTLQILKKMFTRNTMLQEEMPSCKLVSIKEHFMIFQLLSDLMKVMQQIMEAEEIVFFNLDKLMKLLMNSKRQFNYKQMMEYFI